FSSRRRHTRFSRDWSSDVCSSDLGSHAARFWFLLRALGHERIAVLDGGIARWKALDLPLDDEVPSPRQVRYEASFDDDRLLDAEIGRARVGEERRARWWPHEYERN